MVEVGLLKRTFDEHKVRFIAANDNLDTANGFDIMSIFRDVINEWYVADTSRKIKAVFKSRMEKGLRCSGSIAYGYRPDPANKNEWVIDEEAAPVVRRIFQSIIEGKAINEICRELRAEKIPIPSEHWKRSGLPYRSIKYCDPYAWSATTVCYILNKPEYMGRKVLGKSVCENYKTKTHRKTAPEEQYIFEGALPAIVDEDTWNNAQRLRKTVRRPPKRKGAPHRLTGLLYCADCGSKLTHRVNLVQKKYPDDAYVCSRYRKLVDDCSMHYIATAKIESAILTAIQRVSWYVRQNEKEFTRRVLDESNIRQEEIVKECSRKLEQAKRRHVELDALVKKLYEANATGKLPDRHFNRLLAEYDEEQAELEASIAQWQEQISGWDADNLKTERFIEMVKRYTDFTELTTPMLNEFINRVIVSEGEGRGNARRQRLDIHLNFIGEFEVPSHIVTPTEIEEQRRREEKKAAQMEREREREREKNEQVKAKNREFTARRKAGLITPEEREAYEQRLELRREYNKAWKEKKNAALPPKPPKPPSQAEVIRKKSAGLELTPEEMEIYEARKEKRTAQHRVWQQKRRASQPPKIKKPTINEVMARRRNGEELTPEETEIYDRYRERRNKHQREYQREYQRNYQSQRRKAETEEERQARNAKRREAYGRRVAVS